MKQASSLISRRNVLRGLGVTLALPAFESLHAAAAAAGEQPRRLVCVGSHLGFWPDGFFPKGNADLGPTLEPIRKHRDDFTVFSHLDHGVSGGHGAVHTFLSGVKKSEAAGFPERNMSIDQAAAEHVGSATRYPALTTGLGQGTDMCWTRSGVRVPNINSPGRLFQALFVDSDNAALNRERTRLMHRASVLDALRESAKSLNGKLNAADRDKLEQYLTSVREVEQRLQISKEWVDRPKPKSPIDPIAEQERMHIEEMPLFYDLITLALQTDSTRVATFEIPMAFKTSELELGSYHGLSHHGKDKERISELKVVEAYFMKQFAHFMDGLRESGVFDSTLVVFGSGMGNAQTHSSKDLPVILAGGGIRHQGQVVAPAEDKRRIPLSNLWLSTLQWFGLETESFGRSTGTFTPMELG